MHRTADITNVNHLIIYEIFPRNHGHLGNFQDIIDDLRRIRDLGVDVIWLMPIHPIGELNRKGHAGCPYAVQDYLKIHEALGSVILFKELIARTHELGMRLIMDMVFNHTSPDSRLVAEHPEYFYRDTDGKISSKVPDWSDVIDLEYRCRDLWDEQVNVLKYWSSLGVDGFRCDVAPMLPVAFWEFARQQADPNYQQIWIAESVHLSFIHTLRTNGFLCHSDAELYPVFDLTYDYDGFGFLEAWFDGKSPLKLWIDYLNIQSDLYPEYAVKLRFLENHDCLRIASRFETVAQLKNWTVLMFLLPGANLIYSGQEYGLKDGPGLFETEMVNRPAGDEDFHRFFKKILNFIRRYKPEKYRFELRQIRETLIEVKWSGNGEFIGYLNLSAKDCTFTSHFRIFGKDVFNDEPVNLQTGDPIREFPALYRRQLK